VGFDRETFLRGFLSISIGASPIYLWTSGLPQISDILFVICAICCLAVKGFSARKLSSCVPIIVVLVYYLIINLTSGILFEGTHKILYAAYILFALLGILIVSAMSENSILKGLETGFLIGFFILIMQLVVGIDKYPGYRYSLGFNNPNQLGYFSLCGFSFYLWRAMFTDITLKRILILCGFFGFVILSFSKGAIVSILIGFLLFLFISRKIAGLGTALFFVSASTLAVFAFPGIGEEAFNRILNIGGQTDDSLEARGYFVIFEYPEAVVFGQGGGSYLDRGDPHEIHSTYANILVSYGIAGLIGFFYLVGRASVGRRGFILIGPMLLYGLTHNIIRDEFFWLVTGLLFVSTHVTHREKNFREPKQENNKSTI